MKGKSEHSKSTPAAQYHVNIGHIYSPLKFGSTALYQIGRLYSKSNTVIDTHVQGNFFELTIVTDGAGIVTTNNIPTQVERGDIYLSFPCDSHKIESDMVRPLKYDFCSFSTENEALSAELEKLIIEFNSANSRVFRDEKISTLVSNAITELKYENFFSNDVIACILEQIVIYVIRNFKKENMDAGFEHITNAEAQCYRLMNHIDTHIYSIRNLEELSGVMGYSYGYLSTLFKRVTSNTLLDYYQSKKFEVARLLVLEKKLKVREIAEMLNYSSVYAFSKAFKRHFGCSPGNYGSEHFE